MPRETETYNPVYYRSTDSWYPTNRAADLLVHVAHIWEDIVRLNNVRLEIRRQKPDEDKLLFKYVIIEFHSLTEALQPLQTMVAKASVLTKGQAPPLRYITVKEKADVQRLFKDFWKAHAHLKADISAIRNSLGAHRKLQDWQLVNSLWGKLEPDRYICAMNAFIPPFTYLQDLNLYNWSRAHADGSFSIMGSVILHKWEEADLPV